MGIERSNPTSLSNPPGYSHVVKDGTTVYVAGQLARNSEGETVGAGDFTAQAEQAFKNVQAALESVGSNMSSIMKMNVFMTHREDIPAYRVVRAKFVPDDALPVSTLILPVSQTRFSGSRSKLLRRLLDGGAGFSCVLGMTSSSLFA